MKQTTREIYEDLGKLFVRLGVGSIDFSKLTELYSRAINYEIEVDRDRPVPTTELKYPAPSKGLLDKMGDFGLEICKSIDKKSRKESCEEEEGEVSKEDSENMQQSIELTNKNSGFTYTSEEDPAFADEEYPKLDDDDTDMDELEFASEETTKQAFEDMKHLMDKDDADMCDILAKKISNYLIGGYNHTTSQGQAAISAIIRKIITPHLEGYRDLKERHEKALDLLCKADEILFSNSETAEKWGQEYTCFGEMKIEQIQRRHKEQLKLTPEFQALVEKKTGMTIEQIKDLPITEILERTKNEKELPKSN